MPDAKTGWQPPADYGCDPCGKSGVPMDMGQAIEAGWFFTPPTLAPDAPESFCPNCAAFLRAAFADRTQRCRTCSRPTPLGCLKADTCIDCMFNLSRGAALRASRAEEQRGALLAACRQFIFALDHEPDEDGDQCTDLVAMEMAEELARAAIERAEGNPDA